MLRKIGTFALLFVAVFAFSSAAETDNDGKKILTLDDYGQWNRIASTVLSNDGTWMSYAYLPNDGDGTLFFRDLNSATVREVPRGTGPRFSDDGVWVGYIIELSEEEQKKRRESREPITRTVEIRNLDSGDTFQVEGSSSFKFSSNSRFVAIKKDPQRRGGGQPAGDGPPAGRRGGRGGAGGGQSKAGTDLIVRDLNAGTNQLFGNVAAFEFNKPGNLLSYTVSAQEKQGNGLYLFNVDSGALRVLDGAEAVYSQMTWAKEGLGLAAFRGNDDEEKVERQNVLLAFLDLESEQPRKILYDPAQDSSFPSNAVLSEKGQITWSKDLSKLFLGVREQRDKPKKTDDPRANVDVWHYKDEIAQSVQMVRAPRNRQATLQSVYHLDSAKFIKMADPDMPTVTLSVDGKWGVGRLDQPYRAQINWGGSPADYYRIDTRTGARALIAGGIGRSVGLSPDSQWFVYLENKQLKAYNLVSGTTNTITKNSPVSFVNEDDDHPYEKPIFGLAGWSKDGKTILLNHRYDIWSVPLTGGGKPVNLTGSMGDREEIRFRYVNMDPDAPRGRRGFGRRGGGGTPVAIDTEESILFSAYGEWTKNSGYYRLAPGGRMLPVRYEDRNIGGLVKARNADVYAFTMQKFEEFPNYHISGPALTDSKQITDANPQQKEYSWGRRILIDYKNSKGRKMQATLALPGGYEEGKKYPMLVYFYELMSNQHHRYAAPRYDDRPHFSTYASDGYLVLQPDVRYETGYPGDSAVDCVGAAVRKVIELGYADPAHIGLQGHSWGGYQSSFIVTQTDLFAAVVTGAPVTNLISFYNELYKSSGSVQQGIVEKGQVRMGTTPFENWDLYKSQSPVHQAENITTPFLILHGTEDGAVDWHQGLEYFNMARRMGKEVILLSYPGEGHHLAKLENQKDFLTRMKQFFDHYLKDAPAPDWIVNGVSQTDKEYAAPVDPVVTDSLGRRPGN